MCGSTKGGLSVAGIDVTKEAVIQGRVLRGGSPVAGAYVRLLDADGEFTAEVPTSATGHFRFFAGDGTWTLRTLAPGAQADRRVVASRGNVSEVDVELEAA
ncbi:MAG TPA: DUF1416 domain-containing protein [Propionibacteriaceae bacterium]|nr:DUF1416 domain-containing protein [Propionibacteriaceae bacterium]